MTLPVKLERDDRADVVRVADVEAKGEVAETPEEGDGLLLKEVCDTGDESIDVRAEEKLIESPSVDGELIGEASVGLAAAVEGLPGELGDGLAPVAKGTNCRMINLSMSIAPASAAAHKRRIFRCCISDLAEDCPQ